MQKLGRKQKPNYTHTLHFFKRWTTEDDEISSWMNLVGIGWGFCHKPKSMIPKKEKSCHPLHFHGHYVWFVPHTRTMRIRTPKHEIATERQPRLDDEIIKNHGDDLESSATNPKVYHYILAQESKELPPSSLSHGHYDLSREELPPSSPSLRLCVCRNTPVERFNISVLPQTYIYVTI